MNANFKPVQARTESERQARIDLAACYRLAAHFGLNEGIDNHLTLMLPGHEDRFLLVPFGLHWSEVKASDFMVIDFSGQMLSGRGPVEDTALYIHLPVHRLSRRARCVMHTHMPYATALGMLENPRLEMAVQSALGFYDDIAYDTHYSGLAFDASEGERLARALGQSWCARGGRVGAEGIRAAVFSGTRVPGSDTGALDRALLEADS
jgi:ribulose-5-phosphate 4-epimerase/fuculose-1-phosphate aldolase